MQAAKRPTASEPLVDAVLTTSRVLVAIAARSLAATGEDVTLPQYRTLVVLRARGPQTLQRLAEELDVVPSTATRMCDRLVRKSLIRRAARPNDRREIELAIAPRGAAVVDAVTKQRRREISRIVARMSTRRQADLVAALEEFSHTAGEPPDDEWYLGWQ